MLRNLIKTFERCLNTVLFYIMNVYFFLPDLSAGGAERVTITIARLLKKNGFDVGFINLGLPIGEMYDWIVPEFKMVSLGCTRVLSAIPKLHSFMKQHPEAKYFSSREHVNVVGLLCAKVAKCNMIVRIPNMPKNDLVKGVAGMKASIIKKINKRLLGNAKWIIAQNTEMRDQLLEYYGLPDRKVVAINNPIDIDYVRSSAEESINPFDASKVNFLNVCNIAYSKGIDVLEKAWPKVKSVIPNACMNIVGRNTSEYAKELVSKANGLEDFTFWGFQSNPYTYLKHCDVFVLPSRMEGFPNVVLEAQCFNRPVASTTCVAVIKDIIQDGKNGYYCDIEDPEALADCMIKAAKLKNIENKYNLFDKELLLNCFK